jgi:tetratricopeptide (TPR) repeat protein
VRYRTDRAADALADLAEAARLAGELGDRPRQARAQLEAATACDWLGRYDDSARACEEAARLWPDARDPGFVRALAMARGRTAMRAGLYAEARPALEAAIELEGADPGDDRLIAKLLLGPTLVQLGELDAAERVFAAALAAAERLGDGLARCAALGNRVLLWSARRDHARARADLEAARALARRLGHAVPERNATINLAEYLYWTGELDEAARLAGASRELQYRLVGEALEDDVLLARVAAARGDLAAARAALTRAAGIRRAWPLSVRCLRDAVAAFLDSATGDELDRIEAEARHHLVGEDLIEVLAWRVATHDLRGERDAARAAGARARALGVGLQGWRFAD